MYSVLCLLEVLTLFFTRGHMKIALNLRKGFGILNCIEAIGTFEVKLNIFCIMTWPQAFCGLRMECSSLTEADPHRLIYLNAWSLVGGTVWEGLGGDTGFIFDVSKNSCHFQLALSASNF